MVSHQLFIRNVAFPVFLVASVAAGSARAAPPVDTTYVAYRDNTWIYTVGFNSMSVSLEGLDIGNTDLEIKCVEFSAQQRQENTVYGAVSACFDGDISGTEGEGRGFSGKIGYAFGGVRFSPFIDVDGFRISFGDNPTDYEIQGAALNAGIMFAPFKRGKSNSIMSNLMLGAQYSFADYTETISNASNVKRINNLELENDATLLVQFGYIFKNGFGVSFNSSFLARESLELRVLKSF